MGYREADKLYQKDNDWIWGVVGVIILIGLIAAFG